jgi:ADP-ribosylglycohydrolase
MLLEGAIGDAYGAGFEFASRQKIQEFNHLTQYETHPIYKEIRGKYTDDTQMAIGLAELLIEQTEWTAFNIANKFVEVFNRDKRRGYSKRLFKILSEAKNGQEFLNTIISNSTRNGSSMRAYPLGVLISETDILEKCKIQSQITHNTPEAILASQAIALTSHYFTYQKGEKADLLEYLSDIQSHQWSANWTDEVKVDALETVQAVLTLLMQEHTLSDLAKKSVDFGGDVDTVASLTLAIGSMSMEFDNDLPQWMYKNLENDDYGLDFLEQLDERLTALISCY